MCDVRCGADPTAPNVVEDTARYGPMLEAMSDAEFLELVEKPLGEVVDMPDRPPIWMLIDDLHRRDLCSCAAKHESDGPA